MQPGAHLIPVLSTARLVRDIFLKGNRSSLQRSLQPLAVLANHDRHYNKIEDASNSSLARWRIAAVVELPQTTFIKISDGI